MAKSSAIVSPNLGLYFDRSAIALNERMLQDGFNFRIKEGKLSNLNLGWDRFESTIQLNGPVTSISDFVTRSGAENLIFTTLKDIYKYNSGSHTVSYLTPIYSTGTASANGTAVTGIGTDWDPNVKAGDQISFGNANQTSVSATWFTILTRNSDTSLTLTASAGVIGAGVYTIRKLFTGDLQDIWVSDTFLNESGTGTDWWFVTNGLDNIMRWDGSTAQVQDAGLAFKAKALVTYSNMMIYGNLNQGGTNKPADMINSQIGLPADVSGGLSEQFKVHGEVGGIRAMVPLGDALAMYSPNVVTVAQFIGDPLVFTFRQAISGIGTSGTRAVADFGNYHEFVGADSLYQFDGATVKEIGQHVWRDILRAQDPIRIGFTFHHFDDENAELIWVVPATIDPGAGVDTVAPSQAYTEHYLEEVGDQPKPVSARRFPFTSSGYWSRATSLTWADLTSAWSSYSFRWDDKFFFSAFPLNLVGDINGKLYTLNTSQNADTAALPSFVKFGRRAVIDGRLRGMVSRVYPFVSAYVNPLDVTVHLSDHAMGTSTISAEFSFDQTLPEGGHFVSVFRRGRYVEIEYGTDGPGEPWELSGYDLDIKKGGAR